MNKVILLGRLTKDTALNNSKDTAVCRFTMAVERDGKKTEGKPDADFISCVAFGKPAEFIDRYIHNKGLRLLVEGTWRTGSYRNKDGKDIYTNDCVVNLVAPIDWKPKGEDRKDKEPEADEDGFISLSDGEDGGLPFV